MNAMLKSEREDLQRLVRQREKVLKSAARQRSAELIADFENQMGQQCRPDDDPVWAEIEKGAREDALKWQARLNARNRNLGVATMFAPSVSFNWRHRGYGNLLEERRKELRRMAQTAIAAQAQKAIVQIELSCLEAQEKIAVAGLTSDAARGFIGALPSVEKLMPLLSFAEVAGEPDLPIAEQLVSSNALRQQRHRERQKALRNATEPLQVTDRSARRRSALVESTSKK